MNVLVLDTLKAPLRWTLWTRSQSWSLSRANDRSLNQEPKLSPGMVNTVQHVYNYETIYDLFDRFGKKGSIYYGNEHNLKS